MLSEHAEISIREGNWPTALKRLGRLLDVQVINPDGDNTILRLARVFVATGQPAEARRLAVTCDVMTQTRDGKPHSHKALSPFDNDFLAVRNRTQQDFHQDFGRADFIWVAAPVAALYPDVVAFGQRLGGYCAL